MQQLAQHRCQRSNCTAACRPSREDDRGHLKMIGRVRYDLCKFGFSNRVVNRRNSSLPNWIVSANTTNTFQARLDKFWHNQDILYDFKAQLQRTGCRSEVLCQKFK